MNLKKEKQIRKHARKLMIDWLKTVVPEEEKAKITVDNIEDYMPDQTHVYGNMQFRISAYTVRWFTKRIKKLVKKGRKDLTTITVEEVVDDATY